MAMCWYLSSRGDLLLEVGVSGDVSKAAEARAEFALVEVPLARLIEDLEHLRQLLSQGG